MALGWKVLGRITVLLLYGALFFGVYAALHLSLASPPSIQDSREYGAAEAPDYFPVLVVDWQEDGHETLVLRSLARAEYARPPVDAERAWYLYRVPGAGRLTHPVDRVSYRVETLPGRRQRVEVAIGEANGQRTSVYTYEIQDNKVSPRAYLLLASFGNNFSPLPFSLLITAIIVLLAEKFLVRRLLKPSA